jgi:hypothetical protein
MKFDIRDFFENMLRKCKFHQNRTRMAGILREDHYTFLIIPRSILRTKNISHKICRENQNKHFILNNFFSKIVPFVRECGKNIVRAGQVTDDNMAHAHYKLDN